MSHQDEPVLILAPTGRDAQLSVAMLREQGIAAEISASIDELSNERIATAGALLIAEEALPPSAVHALVRVLDAQPQWSDIAVVVLAGTEFTTSTVRPLNVLGPLRNVMILERPVRRLILTRTIGVALRARRRQFAMRDHLNERLTLLRRERAIRADAEKANRLKDEFLMTVSHELRTPLTAIYGWARMLVTGEMNPEQTPRALQTIARNAQALTQLVNDLLDVSRAIAGKVRLTIEPMNLAQVVGAAIEAMQPAADAKGIRLQIDATVDINPLPGDAERMQQVVWNLLSNAIKFTPERGTVKISVHQTDHHAVVTVSDTGCGIAPEFVPFVFDRFRQADAGTTRQYGGLGLGLAIVRHLVELHGGTVSVESDGVGKGSTFRVSLPLAAATSSSGAQEAPNAQNPGRRSAERRLDGLRVLVVDDDVEARELFGVIAENAGADTRLAASTSDALDVVGQWWPDVLISDIEMPREDGYVLMERMRALSQAQQTTLAAIAATAHSRPQDQRRAIEAGYTRHVAKPVEPSELVDVIAAVTGR
jgi:signal transduction histidine kinase/ActR/RegA family two-component response regulator